MWYRVFGLWGLLHIFAFMRGAKWLYNLLIMLGSAVPVQLGAQTPNSIVDAPFPVQIKYTDSIMDSVKDNQWQGIKKELADAGAVNLKNGHKRMGILLQLAGLKLECNRSKEKEAFIPQVAGLLSQTDEVPVRAEILQFLGNICWDCKQQSQSLLHYMHAYDLYLPLRAQDFPHKSEAMYDYAGKYYYFRDFKTAIGIMRQVHSSIDAALIPNRISKLNTLGLCYHSIANYDSAEVYFNQAMLLAEAGKVAVWEGIITGNIANIYFDKKMYDASLKLMLKNIELSEKHKLMGDLALTYIRVAEIYLIQHKKELALEYAKKGQAIIWDKKMNDKPEVVSRFYIILGKVYTANGMAERGFVFLDSGRVAKDSVDARRNLLFLTGIQRKVELAKHNAALLNSEQEITKQRQISAGIFGGLLLACVFAWVVFRQKKRINKEKNRSDELLLNILPAEVALELKNKGVAETKDFKNASILFTDFKDFTSSTVKMSSAQLVQELDHCFKKFDEITTKYHIEKIKTIGDSYMCASGLPVEKESHALDIVNAGLEMCAFIEAEKQRKSAINEVYFEVRIGIHTGPVVAGIVGVKKFAYDIWGDTVNTASRMESSGEVGKVNISETTYQLVKDHFDCVPRGKIEAKGKGQIEMYFVANKKS